MNTTPNINLSKYTSDPNDKFNLLVTFNGNMDKIDTAVGSQNDQIDVIETIAGTAVTTANTASATASEALTTAESKTSVNDNVASATTTYSSNKIDELISGAGGAVIDDSTTALDSTWSSSKINTEVSGKASIDDIAASNTTTYSSLKIERDLNTVDRITTSTDIATSADENITLGAGAYKFNHVVTLHFVIRTTNSLDVSVYNSAITIGTLNNSFQSNYIPNSLALANDKFNYVISVQSGGTIRLTIQKDNATINDFKNLTLYASVTYVID